MKKKVFIVLIIAIIGIVIYGINYLRSPLNSQKPEHATVEVKVDVDAVFVRDEDVYTAPNNGYAYYMYSDGERMKKGAMASCVYAGVPTEDQLKELSAIDRKLKSSMYSASNSIDVSTDPEAAENKIDSFRREIIEASKSADVYSVGEYKAMINAVRANETTVEYIETEESLRSMREATELKIGFDKHEIYSEHSGVFTTILDGLEKVLTPENINNITIKELESVYNIQGQASSRNVKKGEPIFKIVNNHEWYVLVSTDAKNVEGYEVGKRINMRFDNIPGEETEGRIVNIKYEGAKKETALVFIQCQTYLEGAYSFRESKGTIIFDKYSGYKVPVQAVRIEGDQKSVMASDKNRHALYPVRVLYTDIKEGYSIVESVKDSEYQLDNADYIILGER